MGWYLKKTYVAQCDAEIFTNYSKKNHYPKDHLCMLDIDDQDYIDWRLSKPNTQYLKSNNQIYKIFNQNELDLLTMRDETLPSMASTKKINFLTQSLDLCKFKKFDYPFAYKVLDKKCIQKDFHIELLMSDVF